MLAYSDDWALAFQQEINASPVYKQAAAGWEGTVGLVVKAEPDKNVPEDLGVYLDLWHGEAREVKMVPVEEAKACQYVITAAYTRWKEVALGTLDVTKGITLGRLSLKGNFAMIVRYIKASQELTKCTQRIDVSWPDEVSSAV